MKSAVVSIIGRPSAGKSSLMNALCGQKIAIISPSPQTTRNAVRGIYNDSRGQLLFIDTPGYHNSEKQFNLHLQRVAVESLKDSDLILYVTDSTREPGEEEQAILDILKQTDTSVIAVMNKCDHPHAKPKRNSSIIKEQLGDIPRITVSAVTKAGLDELLDVMFAEAPEGEALYPEDYYTDQPPEFRISEIIREQVINRVSQEVPHAVYVEISDIETDESAGRLWIRAFIHVEKESQKGIIVGKKGTMIQAVRVSSQKELAKLFPYAISLDLRVKVQRKWRKNSAIVNRIIY